MSSLRPLLLIALLLSLLAPRGAAPAADVPAPDPLLGCRALRLRLDPALTPEAVAATWGTGAPRAEASAALELAGCDGALLYSLPLEGPLARMEGAMRGAPCFTALVSVDLTAEAGTTSGPLTVPVEVVGDRLRVASVTWEDGTASPIRLPLTGKAAWWRHERRSRDELLTASSAPGAEGFETTLCRLWQTREGWRGACRIEPGLWESDGPRPPLGAFPRGR